MNLVRRMSGGGTVYHDLGNACWSFIVSQSTFDRRKNAGLVAQALSNIGVTDCVVNDRHDIVKREKNVDYKVSGSAFRVSKGRAYHHATMLLNSDLDHVSRYLHSPIEGNFLSSNSVESVKSQVQNLGIDNMDFFNSIIDSFGKEFGKKENGGVQFIEEDKALSNTVIMQTAQNLQSWSWMFEQTPKFSIQLSKLFDFGAVSAVIEIK